MVKNACVLKKPTANGMLDAKTEHYSCEPGGPFIIPVRQCAGNIVLEPQREINK